MAKFLVFAVVAFVVGALGTDLPAGCFKADKIAACTSLEFDGLVHNKRVIWSTVDAVREFK